MVINFMNKKPKTVPFFAKKQPGFSNI